MMKGIDKVKTQKITFGAALAVLFVVCAELYRRMAVCYQGIFGIYYSDISTRMDQMGGDGHEYSLFLMPETFFVKHFGLQVGAVFLGIYLSVFTVATVLVIFQFLKRLCPNADFGLLAGSSFACMFAIPIFMYPLTDYIYSCYVGAIWHSETYLGMRLFALLVLMFFLRTNEHYLEKFSIRDFILESLLFLAVNWIKPNFIIAFGPAMLVMMIVDIIKAKGKGFINWMLYGIPVLIGSAILPVQYLLLFPSSGSGEDAGIILIFGEFFESQRIPIIYFLFAFAFPIFVFVLHRKEFIKSRFHLVITLGWVFAFLEYFFLAESGRRRGHENFCWGLRLFSFIIFCLSVAYFMKDVIKYRAENKQKDKEKKKSFISPFTIEVILLVAHLLSGALYFGGVLLGVCGYAF